MPLLEVGICAEDMARILLTKLAFGFRSIRKPKRFYSSGNTVKRELSCFLNSLKDVTFNPYQVSHLLLGTSFTDADHIDLSLYLKEKETERNENNIPENKKDQLFAYEFKFWTIFNNGLEMLKSYVDHGHDGSDGTILQPLAALGRFISDRKHHEACLRTLLSSKREKLEETEIAAILAIHLISQLIMGDKTPYMISNDNSGKMRWCPCSGPCDAEVVYGNTGIGTTDLWYGKPDIMLFPYGTGACSISFPSSANISDNSVDSYSTMSEVKEQREKPIVEVKCNSSALHEESNIKQIVKQTITFAYYQNVFQQKRQVEASELISLIPTIAMCDDGFDIYMYDTKYDIFIKSLGAPLPIWKDKTSELPTLDMNSVVILWILVNHLLFRPNLTEKIIDSLKGSCGFQTFVSGTQLQSIEKTIRMAKYFKREKGILDARDVKNVVNLD